MKDKYTEDRDVVLGGLLSLLKEREALIMRKAWGVAEEHQPIAQIARELGLSRSRIDQIYKQAFRRIRRVAHSSRTAQSDISELKEKLESQRVDLISGGDIDGLELSVRSYRVLKRHGITTIGQLSAMKPGEILRLTNAGRKTLNDISCALQVRGIRLNRNY